jgi:hypothetical protein
VDEKRQVQRVIERDYTYIHIRIIERLVFVRERLVRSRRNVNTRITARKKTFKLKSLKFI